MNIFGFQMLDSSRQGEVYATDIADVLENALACCPEWPENRSYAILSGTFAQDQEKSKSDHRCKCAFTQEMQELF